jgi:alpha-glucosidase
MRAQLDAYADRLLIGEIYLPIERLVAYYGTELSGAHLPFNFQLIFARWSPRHIARIVEEYEAALPAGGWPNWVLGNHDQKRIATRVGEAQARIAAMLLLTLRGTPTIYYGDEIGLQNVPVDPAQAQDPWERNEPGLDLGRDPQRTPMPWDGSEGGGFTTGVPWLPLNADRRTRNVASLAQDPHSILHLYRALIALRGSHPALQAGAYVPLMANETVLAFERHDRAGQRLLVALNFGTAGSSLSLPDVTGARLLLSTTMTREGDDIDGMLHLHAAEGVVLELRT